MSASNSRHGTFAIGLYGSIALFWQRHLKLSPIRKMGPLSPRPEDVPPRYQVAPPVRTDRWFADPPILRCHLRGAGQMRGQLGAISAVGHNK